MGNLVVFGCSLTQGHSLDNPEQECWPYVVAQGLGKQLINTATPGSSNKRIWHTVVNYKFNPDDIVLILWTYENRTAVIKENAVQDILPFDSLLKTREMNYYKFAYDSYDSAVMSKLFVSHTDLILKTKQIEHYHLVIHQRNLGIVSLPGSRVEYIPIYFDGIWQNYPLANDQSHPGKLAHKEFGEKILKYLLDNQLTNGLKLNII